MADLRDYHVARDLDTGGGTEYVLGVNLRLSASGGSIEALGQKVMASSIPVTLASDQGNINIALAAASATVTVDTELPAAGALADGATNPTTPLAGACLLGFNGTTWDRVYTRANADAYASGTKGFLLLGQNGTTDYRAISVSATGLVNVSVGAPTLPVNTYKTSAALAAGSSANLDTGDLISAATVRLSAVEVWSSVPIKILIYTIANGVASSDPVVVGGAAALEGWQYKAPHPDYFKLSNSAGVDGYRAAITNLDPLNAADIYATFHSET